VRLEKSAGGVVFRRTGGVHRVLVIRDPYGQWGLPKGHLEEGEEAHEAALREVREETGLVEVDLGREIGTIDWYFRDDETLIHKYCTFYLMHSPRGSVEPEREEGISECVWLPMDSAVERVSYDDTQEVVREAVRMIRDDDGDPGLEL